jgi:bacillolysin
MTDMRTFTLLLNAIFFTASSAMAQYCMLPGRTPYANEQPGITNFKLNTINRTSTNIENGLANPPITVTTDTTTLVRGQSYTVTIVHSKDATNFPTAHNNIRVWIDYNKDQDFVDADETVVSKDNESPGTTTASFTVPATAPIGYTRLRVTAKMAADAGHTIPTSCDMPQDPLGYHGEMEDYTVKIAYPTSVGNAAMNDAGISVYPNPASNMVTISFNSVTHKAASIDLFDITGKLVSNLLTTTDQSATEYTFQLNNYINGKGIYFIKTTSGDIVAYQKLIKVD